MRDENARVREKFELSLDGRQIASIVVGALVILGVVFVLGLNVGRQIATRQVDAARAGDLEALDRPPSTPSSVDDASLTFHDRLVKQKPAATPLTDPSPAPTAATPTPTPSAAAAATITPASTSSEPSTKPAADEAEVQARAAKPSPAPSPAGVGAFTIQIGATQQRAEADRIVARYRSLRPRVEAADVQGKGRWYRVRVGSFETREAAERYRKDVSRETGVPGFVTASR